MFLGRLDRQKPTLAEHGARGWSHGSPSSGVVVMPGLDISEESARFRFFRDHPNEVVGLIRLAALGPPLVHAEMAAP